MTQIVQHSQLTPHTSLPDVFLHFSRKNWAHFRDDLPLPLSAEELADLRSLGDHISLEEVAQVYLPLCRLLSLHVGSRQNLHRSSQIFLGHGHANVPFIIAIAGSVAVGKSTTARLLQKLLSRWPNHPKVDLIPTDGFLLPNVELKKRGLMHRKGFPESYDLRQILNFLAAVKSGQRVAYSPVYSHLHYDVLPKQYLQIRQPEILLIEGLNLLQVGEPPNLSPKVSDYFDFSIYVDADPVLIEKWYCQRFLQLRNTAFQDPLSYFHHYASLSKKAVLEEAKRTWRQINLVNLVENILPTKQRASLILEKRHQHNVSHIHLRKL